MDRRAASSASSDSSGSAASQLTVKICSGSAEREHELVAAQIDGCDRRQLRIGGSRKLRTAIAHAAAVAKDPAPLLAGVMVFNHARHVHSNVSRLEPGATSVAQIPTLPSELSPQRRAAPNVFPACGRTTRWQVSWLAVRAAAAGLPEANLSGCKLREPRRSQLRGQPQFRLRSLLTRRGHHLSSP